MLPPLFAITFLGGNHINKRVPRKLQSLTQGNTPGRPREAAGKPPVSWPGWCPPLAGTKPLDGSSYRHLTRPCFNRDEANLSDTNELPILELS